MTGHGEKFDLNSYLSVDSPAILSCLSEGLIVPTLDLLTTLSDAGP